MEYILFKKHSKSKDKDYYELCSVENGKFKSLGFVHIKDKTQKPINPKPVTIDTSNCPF